MKTNKDSVYRYLDDHKNDIAKTLGKLIQFDTQNFNVNGPAVEAVAQEYVCEQYKDLGLNPWKAAFDSEKKRPNVCGTMEGTGKGKNLLLFAHMDTVDIMENLEWDCPPLSGAVKNNRIYGRGAVDDKGGIAAGYWAVKAIKECGLKLKGDVTLISSVAEETCEGDIIGAGAAARSLPKKPDFAIACEGSEMCLEVASANLVSFEVTVKGKPASVACKGQAVNPQPYGIACGNEIGVDAFQKATPIIEMLSRKERDWNLNHRHPVWGSGGRNGKDGNGVGVGYINLSMIRGGDMLASIMGSVTLTYFCAFSPYVSIKEMQKDIVDSINAVASTDSWLKDNPPIIKMSLTPDWPAYDLPIEHPYSQLCADVYKDLFQKEIIYTTGRANDDAGWISATGIPALSIGAGGADRMHVPNEYLEIEELRDAAKIYAGIILDFCEIDE